MKQDYRLLVLDLDGTLTNSKKEISPRNLRTLLRLQQSGVRLVLASGRPTYGIVPLAEQLQMKENNGYILSYNGGEIIDWSTGELLYKICFPMMYCLSCTRLQPITGKQSSHTTTSAYSPKIPTTRTYRKKHSSTKCRYAA